MGGMSGGGGGGMGQMFSQISADVGEKGNFLVSNYQNNKAANDLTRRQNEANDLYRQNYAETQAGFKPYAEGGASAYDQLLKSYGVGGAAPDYSQFYQSPDYQFALTQGQNALDRSAASRGRLFSGAQMQGSQRFGQDLATQYLGNYRTGLGNLAGMGMNAQNSLANYRAGYGNQLGQGITNLGDISAAERLGIASINDRYNQRMQNIWGVGSGGGGQSSYNFGGGQNSLNSDPNASQWTSGGRKYGGTYG